METCIKEFFIYDNEILKNIDFNETMVSNGKSIYEVIRVIDGVPLFLEKHLERLMNSVKISNLKLKFSHSDIKESILKLIEINNVSTAFIISTITGGEIEGSNILFWFSNNHKITPEEASTFKLDKVVSKTGFENIKYVYGSISFVEKKKSKSAKFVGQYFLVYEAEGYKWRLNKLVGEDSPNYKEFENETESQ